MVGRVGFISGRGLKNEGIVGVEMVDSYRDCLQSVARKSAILIAKAGEQIIAKITTITISCKFFISTTTGFRFTYYIKWYDSRSCSQGGEVRERIIKKVRGISLIHD